MRVLIVEQKCKHGHYLNYVQYLVRAFVPLGCEIVVAVPPGTPESAQFKMHLAPHQAHFRLEFIPARDETAAAWKRINTDARVFRAVISRVKPDAVYLPTGDGVAQSLAFGKLACRRTGLSRVHCEALLIRVPAAYGMDTRSPFLTKVAFQAMPFDVVHYIDPVAFDWVLNNVGSRAGRKARFIADPIEPIPLLNRSDACAKLGLPESRKLIMSVGLQDHRKGVDYLIKACARWKPTGPASIVLAGMLSPQIKELLTRQYRYLVDDGRLIVLDRYLSNDEINACCAAGDLITTPYRPHPHPSAIVLYAIHAGKMVLAANNGWFSYMVPKFALGRLCEPQDPELLAESLNRALHEAEGYQVSPAAKRLVEFNRSENFVRQWRQELSKLMGKREQARIPDWNWVLTGDENKSLERRGGPGQATSDFRGDTNLST